MPDPILENLGSLVTKTNRWALEKPAEGAPPEGPLVDPADLQGLVAPQPVAPSPAASLQQPIVPITPEEIAGAPRFSDFPPEMQRAELLAQHGMEIVDGQYQAMKYPPPQFGEPDPLGHLDVLATEREYGPLPENLSIVPPPSKAKQLEEHAYAKTAATESRIKQNVRVAEESKKVYEDTMAIVIGIARKPVDEWEPADEQLLKNIIGPENLKDWLESDYEKNYLNSNFDGHSKYIDLGGEEAQVYRGRRALLRALYFQHNRFAKAMALKMSLPQMWLAENDDLAAFAETSVEVRSILNDEGLLDDQRIDMLRETLADHYGGIKDANGVQRGRDFAYKLLRTPEDVMKQANFLLTSESVAAGTELRDRKVGFIMAGIGIGNMIDAEQADPSMIKVGKAKTVPPIGVLINLYRARYQVPEETITDGEIKHRHPRFVHITELYNEWEAARGDFSRRKSAAENILREWKAFYKVSPGQVQTTFAASAALQVFNHSIAIPFSAWDGVT